jgi:hypothetical protein
MEGQMARRTLLTDEERRLLFGIPLDPDTLARCYSFTRSDQELVASRRGDANRLGFAVQLALLRHPGASLTHIGEPIEPLVAWLARRLEIPAASFVDYAGRTQTMSDHARILAGALGLRSATAADLPLMIEAAAQSAWSTDRGQPIAAGIVAALRAGKVILPAPAVIERAAIAGRARARKRAADALLAGISESQLARLDLLLAPDRRSRRRHFPGSRTPRARRRRTTLVS